MKRNTWNNVLIVCLLFICSACNIWDKRKQDIVILYDNDVHCAVDGYANMAGLKNQALEQTPYVSVVSCGDFVQGDVIGTLSEGRFIEDIMNQVGYDVVVMGNHEFDYGFPVMEETASQLNATVVSCNLVNLNYNKTVFEPYKIINYGSTKVAYVGVMTPESLTSSPYTFMDVESLAFDEKGKLIEPVNHGGTFFYDFCADSLYKQVQKNVDAARREGAHFVVVLSHLGDELLDPSMPTSLSLIKETHGINVVLDGHAHHVIPDTIISNKQNKPVHLSSTGSNFQHIGKLTIMPDSTLSLQLLQVDTLTVVDDSVKQLVDTLKNHTLVFGQERVGRTPFPLIANDAQGNRIVRQEETNLANFCTDAFRIMLDTDIALINAGGIRDNIAAGDITYNDLLRVFPFKNTVCIATITGKQLVDVLEYSTRYLPKESGGLLHVSGLRYIVIDNECPAPIIYDENNLFVALASKSERLDRIEIWDKQAQRYVPIKKNKEYTIAALDYHIEKMGGNGILRNAVLKQDKMKMDVDVLSAYLFSLNGCVPAKYAKPEGRMMQTIGICECQCDEP